MKKRHWRAFNFSEWRAEATLKGVSREARSFWLDLCGLIYDAEDNGRLTRLRGKPFDAEDVAAVLGDDIRVVKRLLKELGAAKVYSIDPDGAIFCRRIRREKVAENAKAKKDVAALPPEVGEHLRSQNNKIKAVEKHTDTHIPELDIAPSGQISNSVIPFKRKTPVPARAEGARDGLSLAEAKQQLAVLKDQFITKINAGDSDRAAIKAEITRLERVVDSFPRKAES
jgi:hypothetical protein